MKNRIKYLYTLLLTVFVNIISFAQFEGEGDPQLPPPEGIGAPASPIDMYLYLLAIVAFGFMWYYHAKTRKTLG